MRALVSPAPRATRQVRCLLDVAVDATEEAVAAAAREQPGVLKFIEGKTLKKQIFVPGKILNLVVG